MSDAPVRFSTLFGALDEAGRKRLLSLSAKHTFAPGEVICREGEKSTDFFVITKGTVTVEGDNFGTAKALATLGPGDFFGELAALAGQPRQATVTAAEPLDVLRIPFTAVNEVFKASPKAFSELQKAGLHRVEDTMQKLMD